MEGVSLFMFSYKEYFIWYFFLDIYIFVFICFFLKAFEYKEEKKKKQLVSLKENTHTHSSRLFWKCS